MDTHPTSNRALLSTDNERIVRCQAETMKSVNYKNTVEGFCEMRSKQMCEFSNDFFWHKRRRLVNDNIAEYNASQKKRNNHETIHDGAIGMTSQLVGFLKQAKNHVSD